MTAVEIHPRAVSKARREAVIAKQDGICKRANCDAPAVYVDHVIPLWCGGTNANDNLEGLCAECHRRKTSAEAKARAKAKRIEARDKGTRRPRKPIMSKGFGSVVRKMDGSIGLTRKAARAAAANDADPPREGGAG